MVDVCGEHGRSRGPGNRALAVPRDGRRVGGNVELPVVVATERLDRCVDVERVDARPDRPARDLTDLRRAVGERRQVTRQGEQRCRCRTTALSSTLTLIAGATATCLTIARARALSGDVNALSNTEMVGLASASGCTTADRLAPGGRSSVPSTTGSLSGAASASCTSGRVFSRRQLGRVGRPGGPEALEDPVAVQ